MKKYISLFIIISFIFIGRVGAFLSYKVGDVVLYNNILFYVIEDSDDSKDNVTLLKSAPLTVDEVNKYGIGHVNMYENPESPNYQTASNQNGYGLMAYYTSETCGYNGSYVTHYECKNDYASSEVKYVVDAWAKDKITSGLVEARLITAKDLTDNLGYEYYNNETYKAYIKTNESPYWVSSKRYSWWTSISFLDSTSEVLYVSTDLIGETVSNLDAVRPVVTIKKSEISKSNLEVEYKNIKYYIINDDKNNNTITLLKAEPIRSKDIKDYISSTEIASKIDFNDTYVKLAYYSRDNCVSNGDISGCSNDYKTSNIKQLVDVWSDIYLDASDLISDSTGYSARLLTIDDLTNYLGYEYVESGTSKYYNSTENTPYWVYLDYPYSTMSPSDDDNTYVWGFDTSERLQPTIVAKRYVDFFVRPVVTLKREAIYGSDSVHDKVVSNDVKVPNTYMQKSLIIIIIGFIMVLVGVIIYYIISNKKERK